MTTTLLLLLPPPLLLLPPPLPLLPLPLLSLPLPLPLFLLLLLLDLLANLLQDEVALVLPVLVPDALTMRLGCDVDVVRRHLALVVGLQVRDAPIEVARGSHFCACARRGCAS